MSREEREEESAIRTHPRAHPRTRHGSETARPQVRDLARRCAVLLELETFPHCDIKTLLVEKLRDRRKQFIVLNLHHNLLHHVPMRVGCDPFQNLHLKTFHVDLQQVDDGDVILLDDL